MTRREAIAALVAAPMFAADGWDGLFGDRSGVAIAVDFHTGALLGSHRLNVARNLRVAPGSILKPLSLLALADAGKLGAEDLHPCSGRLVIGRHSLACVHPATARPFQIASALAYSCNEFVTDAAARFAPGELAAALERFGLTAKTPWGGDGEAAGIVGSARTVADGQLQAIGEQGVEVTALGIAAAYRRLASRITSERTPVARAIMEGLEGAVQYGTAQRAAVPKTTIAGKTGSAHGGWAWFAGFGPSRGPRVVVTVLVRGYSGGADAAPIAGRILSSLLGSA